MKYPHHRYTKYLISLDLDDDEVRRVLVLDELVPPSPADLARFRYDLADRPKSFRPFDKNHEISAEWLVQQGLSGMMRGHQVIRDALSVARSPLLRQPTELLLLGGHPPGLLPRFCADHDLPTVSEDAVRHFRHYFWDVQGLALDDWAVFLRHHPNGEVYKEALGQGQARALVLADLFAQRAMKLPVLSTIPGAGGGGGFIKPPPGYFPRPGPDQPLAEP